MLRMILFVIITRLTYLYALPEGSLNAKYRISNLDADLSSPDADLSMMSRHTIFQHVEIRSGREV